ncbi:hypothetical protein Godav_009139 [Gossypium davidsonii]|uniref:Uncharacterized protein n=2 Tax=Gossypium TaxID=3633 RepID=A0A7J8SCW2_GOSDV|nr:hypothetical protein [Gossypium davidsonii]MBA0659272.1 hypothetical protein [Gossypium klotzschianum]
MMCLGSSMKINFQQMSIQNSLFKVLQ